MHRQALREIDTMLGQGDQSFRPLDTSVWNFRDMAATANGQTLARQCDSWASPNDPAPVVSVIDSDDAARQFLETLLGGHGWRTEAFTCAQEFLKRPSAFGASCLVTEVALPDIDGLELQQRLAADESDMPIVFVTRCGDVATTVKAMKAGAVNFIAKPFDGSELLAAVAEAIERSRVLLRQRAQIRKLRDRYQSLTPRERCHGRRDKWSLNKQIAADLDISEITVKVHRGRMMRKMDARSLAALVDIAGPLSSSGIPCRRYAGVAA